MSDEPPVTHGIRPKRSGPVSVEIYIPDRDEGWVREAMGALKRDGSSISAWTLAQLRAWWDMHRPGNPQLGMERFVQGFLQGEAAVPSCSHQWLLTHHGFTAPVWVCEKCETKKFFR